MLKQQMESSLQMECQSRFYYLFMSVSFFWSSFYVPRSLQFISKVEYRRFLQLQNKRDIDQIHPGRITLAIRSSKIE